MSSLYECTLELQIIIKIQHKKVKQTNKLERPLVTVKGLSLTTASELLPMGRGRGDADW